MRACRVFSPAYAASISIQVLRVEVDDYFRATPFLAEVTEDLLRDACKYHQIAVSQVEKWKLDRVHVCEKLAWKFWQNQKFAANGTMQSWIEAAKKVALVFVSSCPAERVFSIWKSCFGNDDRTAALADMQIASVMTKYNNKKREDEENDA